MFCETPYQSISIGFISGIISGILFNTIFVTLLSAVLIAILLEILLHEYRKDTQYMNAKDQLKTVISSFFKFG